MRRAPAAALAASLALLVLTGSGCAALTPVAPPTATAPAPHRSASSPAGQLEARSTPSLRRPTFTAGTPTIKGFTAYERAALRIRNIGCGGVSSGSGFAIKDRVLVTNRHVVQGASVLQVETYDGRSRDVQTAGAVAFADLAVVFLQGDLPATLPLADRNPAVGDRITVVGYPLGGQLTTSEGQVLGYGADPLGASEAPMIRNDAPIAPGSSGSPLVDAAGKVVGVAYAGSPGGPFWAVPIELLLSISHGKQAVQPVPECE